MDNLEKINSLPILEELQQEISSAMRFPEVERNLRVGQDGTEYRSLGIEVGIDPRGVGLSETKFTDGTSEQHLGVRGTISPEGRMVDAGYTIIDIDRQKQVTVHTQLIRRERKYIEDQAQKEIAMEFALSKLRHGLERREVRHDEQKSIRGLGRKMLSRLMN